MGLAFVFANNVSQNTQDIFSSIEASDYGQDPNSSFSQVSSSNQGVVVTEGTTNNYNPATNTLTFNPNSSAFITVDSEGTPNNGSASLESIFVHETQHAFDDLFNPDDYSDYRDTEGEMGDSVLEDRAMSEANTYRSLVGEDLRIWYNDLNDYLEQ